MTLYQRCALEKKLSRHAEWRSNREVQHWNKKRMLRNCWKWWGGCWLVLGLSIFFFILWFVCVYLYGFCVCVFCFCFWFSFVVVVVVFVCFVVVCFGRGVGVVGCIFYHLNLLSFFFKHVKTHIAYFLQKSSQRKLTKVMFTVEMICTYEVAQKDFLTSTC